MKKAFKFLIPVLALVMIAAVFSIIASADGGEDEFAGLPVVFIATEAKGTGDGSSAENAHRCYGRHSRRQHRVSEERASSRIRSTDRNGRHDRRLRTSYD